MREQAAKRYDLAERHELALDVDGGRPLSGYPQLAGVADRVPQDLADQDRSPDSPDRGRDFLVDLRELERVQIGRVLRPDHDVGRGPGTSPDLSGELLGGRCVVLRDLS